MEHIQCICGSRSPDLWWTLWAGPVCTALCRSEAALTPRTHCCTSPGSPWCGPGPAEGCRAFLYPRWHSHSDWRVLEDWSKNRGKERLRTQAIAASFSCVTPQSQEFLSWTEALQEEMERRMSTKIQPLRNFLAADVSFNGLELRNPG